MNDTETINEIAERLIVINRCLQNMFTTAILPIDQVAEQLRDFNLKLTANDIFEIKYAPQYASVMAIEPVSEKVFFEEGEVEDILQSGYYDSENETIDSTFSFDLAYTYGDFAVILLTSAIELNNLLFKNKEYPLFNELKHVAALTTIHRNIAEKNLTLYAKQIILDAAYYTVKSLNEWTEQDD